MNLNVLYEDNHLIAVFKPAGVLVQGDETGDRSLMDDVKEYLKEKYNKPGNVFLGLIHRIDRPVSGVVLFAKTSKGASRLSEQFRDHKAKKVYEAWVEGVPRQNQGTLIDNVIHFEKGNVGKVVRRGARGAERAELSYEVVESKLKFSKLKINLRTGKHHQIRIQLSHMGNPVVGDRKYGGKYLLPEGEILLRAIEISFHTATSEEKITVRAESMALPSNL